jgi:hypothetical protein
VGCRLVGGRHGVTVAVVVVVVVVVLFVLFVSCGKRNWGPQVIEDCDTGVGAQGCKLTTHDVQASKGAVSPNP